PLGWATGRTWTGGGGRRRVPQTSRCLMWESQPDLLRSCGFRRRGWSAPRTPTGAMAWTPEEVLTAVRSSLLVERPFSNWTYERADLEGTDILVVFRVKATAPVRAELGDADRFGVLYPLGDLPNGPSTGTPWDT